MHSFDILYRRYHNDSREIGKVGVPSLGLIGDSLAIWQQRCERPTGTLSVDTNPFAVRRDASPSREEGRGVNVDQKIDNFRLWGWHIRLLAIEINHLD